MSDTDLLIRLTVSLAVGILVGVERGWHERHRNAGERIAGIRTFTLIGFLGGLLTGLPVFMPWGFIAGFVAIAVLMSLGWYKYSGTQTGIGVTTVIAVLVTYVLGGLAGQGEIIAAGAGAVVTALLLYFKPSLHTWLEQIRDVDINAGLRLLAISVLLLPILPDHGYGPWQVLNPFHIWIMVVAIAGLSFFGYVLIRLFGARRGILFAALAGGFVSSTAVTISFSKQSCEATGAGRTYMAGILLANLIVFPRMLLIAGVIAPTILPVLVPAMGAAVIVGLALAALLLRRQESDIADAADIATSITNPLQLRTALSFGLLLSLILLATRAASEFAGTGGIYGLALLSGFADVDPISLSLATQVAGDVINAKVAATGVALAVTANLIVKGALAIRLADQSLKGRLGQMFALFVVAVLAGLGAGLWII